jgi:hypothetical protein
MPYPTFIENGTDPENFGEVCITQGGSVRLGRRVALGVVGRERIGGSGGLVGGRLVLLGEEGFDVLAEDTIDAADFMGMQLAVANQALHRADRDLHQRSRVDCRVDRSHGGDNRPRSSFIWTSRIGAGSSPLVRREIPR